MEYIHGGFMNRGGWGTGFKGEPTLSEMEQSENYRKGMAYVTSLGIRKTEAESNLEKLVGYIVIKIGGECVNGDYTLPKSIAVLNQLGEYPIIIHGGGPQIDALMKAKGIPVEKVYGRRVTSKQVLEECVLPALSKVNSELVDTINQNGGKSISLSNREVIYVEPDNPKLGLVGIPKYVNIWPVIKHTDKNFYDRSSVVLWCVGYDISGQTYNVNADLIIKQLIFELQSRANSKMAENTLIKEKEKGVQKVILVTASGGVLKDDQLISTLNYVDIPALISSGVANGGMALKLNEAYSIFNELASLLPSNFKVQIIGPKDLLHELLTDKGAGTEIVRG